MKQQSDHLQDLKEIRNLMERSSRFTSLSGLSGILAGVFALAGAFAAYIYLDMHPGRSDYAYTDKPDFYLFFFLDAGLVLTLAISCGLYFTVRQARKKRESIWDKTSRRLFINMCVPLVCGGIFCLGMLYHGYEELIAPSTLLFYGMALLNASKFTFDDIRYLAFLELALGLVSLFFTGYGLLFWAIGFGILHIIYGTIMYFKYEK